LILLAFILFPLAVYLLVLGAINRRRHPLIVSGTWDLVGLLFAVSGFLLVAGPAILSSGSERWRQFWLLGQAEFGPTSPDGARELWVFLSILYFALVVGGAAMLFWRNRHLTSIYNIASTQFEQALAEVCDQLELQPVRSGNLYLFGFGLGSRPQAGPADGLEGIQAPHYLPAASRAAALERLETSSRRLAGEQPAEPGTFEAGPAPTGSSRARGVSAAILEVDDFRALHHITLRWDPADAALRQEIEAALADRLAESPTPPHELGGWLFVIGFLLLALTLLGCFGLFVMRLARR
jgi:hypothetical protein